MKQTQKQKDDKQTVKDEASAEVRYRNALAAAKDAADALAQKAETASKKAAAQETARFLGGLEDIRITAEQAPPEQVHKTFWQAVKDFVAGPDPLEKD